MLSSVVASRNWLLEPCFAILEGRVEGGEMRVDKTPKIWRLPQMVPPVPESPATAHNNHLENHYNESTSTNMRFQYLPINFNLNSILHEGSTQLHFEIFWQV